MPSTTCKVTSIVMVVCLFLGIVLVGALTSKYQENKSEHDDKYEYTSAQIVAVEKNPSTCYEETGCSNCQGGGSNPSCASMIASNQTGQCSSSRSRCCREQCWRRSCSSSGRCSDVMCFSFEFCSRCSCVDVNRNPLCDVISGTCYNPYITVTFSDLFGSQVETSATRHCKIGETSCADDYVKGRVVGDYVPVYYLQNDPRQISLDSQPKYKMSAGTIAGIVIGSIALLGGFSMACLLVFLFFIDRKEHFGCSGSRTESKSTIVDPVTDSVV